MDWLVAGLGNPGPEYARTPHNVGFLVVAELQDRWGLGRAKEKFAGRYVEGRVLVGDRPGPRVAVLAPQTFMNDAGRSVGPARGALKLDLDHVVVVHDELDLPFGEVRSRVGGGHKGHNGLRSVIAGLGGPGFVRVGCGIGRPPTKDPDAVSAYVLGRWRRPEHEVAALVARAADEVERLVGARQGAS